MSMTGSTTVKTMDYHVFSWTTREEIPEAFRFKARPTEHGFSLKVASYDLYDRAHNDLDRLSHKYDQLSNAVVRMLGAMRNPHTYVITSHKIEGINEWCNTNIQNGYEVLLNHDEYGALVLFETEQDATMFKLFLG